MTALKLFKKDFYRRIGGFKVFRGRRVLDVGCGDGKDAQAIAHFAKKVTGLDVVTNHEWNKKKTANLSFIGGDAQKLPFKNGEFDGIFLKDVLHHADNPEQVLKEIKRVAAKNAVIMIIEGNRYNPLFYIHMTKLGGHEHLTQNHFKSLIKKYFPDVQFIHFESHFIPFINESVFRVFIAVEHLLDKLAFLRQFLSYNVAIKK